MKKTSTLKLVYCFTILLLCCTNYAYSQVTSWDYIDFEEGSSNSLNNACLDSADNIYTYGLDTSYNNVIRKFDPSGNLTWTKNVSSMIDLSNDNTMTFSSTYSNGVGGIAHSNSLVYVIGNNNDHGVILESGDQSADATVIWEQLSGTNESSISGIKLKGNHLYVVGFFGGINSSSTSVTFDGGTTLNGSYKSAFIAKYTYPSKTLVWAKKIHASNITNAVNIDVDDSDNIFVTGHFRGTATFYDGGTPYTFTSSTPGTSDTPDVFLAKFDSNGDFDNGYGLKTEGTTNNFNWRSYDVKVDNLNDAVYWAMDSQIAAFSKSGSGSFLWLKELSENSDKPFNLAVNECGDVYATGYTGGAVNRSTLARSTAAPCGRDFFALALDAVGGNSLWSSNSSSCISSGNEILIDSNNKQIVVGTYYTGGGSGTLNIDGSFSSSTSHGYFIGRSDDSSYNSCCNDNLDLGGNVTVCANGSFPTLDISGQVSGSPSITWYLDGSVVQNGGTTLTTSQIGTYSVQVYYSQDCIAEAQMEVNNDGCCDYEVDLGPNITICEGEAWPVLDITGQIPGFTSIEWLLNGNPFQQPYNSETITTFSEGSYTVNVTYADGCTTSDVIAISVIDCEPKCEISPGFDIKIKDCTVGFMNESYAYGSSSIIGYLWEFGDGSTSTDVNPVHAYSVGGTYNVTLWVYGIDSEGNCCVIGRSRQITINQSCLPKCKFKATFTNTNIANGVVLFEAVTATNGFTSIVGYEWTVNGVVVSNDSYAAAEFYGGQVCLTVYGMTSNGECCQRTICKSFPHVQRQEANSDFKIFPNPIKEKVTLDFSELDTSKDIQVKITDLRGTTFFETSTQRSELNVVTTNWPVGVYICNVLTHNTVITKKVIKK